MFHLFNLAFKKVSSPSVLNVDVLVSALSVLMSGEKRQVFIREAFIKKKKKCNKCYLRGGGGGPADKMLHFLKLCLKSISGYSVSFW